MFKWNLLQTMVMIFLVLLCGRAYSDDSLGGNRFVRYDNYLTIDYLYSVIQDTASIGTIGVSGEVLFKNNLWLSAQASGLVTYDVSNNNRGLYDLSQNKSGSSFLIRGGYGLNFDKLNFIPYAGFSYNNLLVAYNYDSSQQFLIENPSYNVLLGFLSEYDLLESSMKIRVDNGISYDSHKTVMPNTSNTLGHIDYSNYLYHLGVELQYLLSSKLTVMAYYGLSLKFAGNAEPVNVYYPQINTSSANLVDNENLINSFGIKFGVVF